MASPALRVAAVALVAAGLSAGCAGVGVGIAGGTGLGYGVGVSLTPSLLFRSPPAVSPDVPPPPRVGEPDETPAPQKTP